ncbi:unnamed protein product [Fusarium equiseti]|uniref:Uncharacterized protein n=1 Tax=Fusarium equiseti TaxID=61235 RepID=A0A8J2IKX4_FUSEQ|nr:unnamed protein product [Fusarium equiseti]
MSVLTFSKHSSTVTCLPSHITTCQQQQRQRGRLMVARAFTAASEKPAGSIGGGGSGVSSGTHCLKSYHFAEVEIGDLQRLAATEPAYRHAPAIGAEYDKAGVWINGNEEECIIVSLFLRLLFL